MVIDSAVRDLENACSPNSR